MKQAFDSVPESERQYLESRGYKFHEEKPMPKFLSPFSA